MAARFMWWAVGGRYEYRARQGKGLDLRRGQLAEIVTIGAGPGPRNMLIRFADGFEAVTYVGALSRKRVDDACIPAE